MENPNKEVRIKCASIAVMKRVKKAVWKEKDLDQEFARDENGELILDTDNLPIRRKLRWRLNCVMDEKIGMLTLRVIPKLTEDHV